MASAIELSQFFSKMKELYPEVTITDAWASEWLDNFRYCPIDVLYKALKEFARTSKFKPSLSEMYGIATQLAGGKFRRPQYQTTDFALKWNHAQREKGFVHTGKWGWKPESDCVRHKGTWKPKLEFLIDVLGGDAVTNELKDLFGVRQQPEWRAVRLVYSAMKRQENREKYQAKINDLVTQAKYFEGMLKQEEMNI